MDRPLVNLGYDTTYNVPRKEWKIYKGGVARRAFCLEFGFPEEVVCDIDYLESLADDRNVMLSGVDSVTFDEQLWAYMKTRDVSINEVLLLDDGTIYYSEDCMRSFEEKLVIVKEETPRAFLRAIRFAARYGFKLDLGQVSIQAIHTSTEFHDEVIHQWTKSICESLEEAFLSRIQWLWSPDEGDKPLDWREVRIKRSFERVDPEWVNSNKEASRRSRLCRQKELRRALRS